MSAIAEFVLALMAWLIEISIYIAYFAFAPLRFLFSSRYRVVIYQQWLVQPGRCVAKMVGGSIALVLFIGMLIFWAFFFIGPSAPPTNPVTIKIDGRIIEKIREFRNRSK